MRVSSIQRRYINTKMRVKLKIPWLFKSFLLINTCWGKIVEKKSYEAKTYEEFYHLVIYKKYSSYLSIGSSPSVLHSS